jgi:hypothetical protein
VQPAKADIFTSTIDTGNTALTDAGFTGPYATVTIDLTSSTTALVTFASLTQTVNNQDVIYLMGDGSSAALNVNGTFSVSNIVGTNAGTGFTPGPYTSTGAGNVDGHGTFNLTIKDFDGFGHAADQITFDLTATGTTTWASASAVLFANSDGFDAASHIFPSLFPADASNNTFGISTGFAAESGGGTHVPDSGTTAMLLGTALVGLGAVRRYLKR